MGCNKIITITRQFGSGGHEIGAALAERLGIGFYDKELISLAAKESGIAPEVFEHADEKASNSLLYSLSMGLYNYGAGFSSSMGDLPVNDKLYILQHRIIKEKAENECFVIVGRCADYILRNQPNARSTDVKSTPPELNRRLSRQTRTERTTTAFIQDRNGVRLTTLTCVSTAQSSQSNRRLMLSRVTLILSAESYFFSS